MKFGIILTAIFAAMGVFYTPWLLFMFLRTYSLWNFFWFVVWGYITYTNLTALREHFKLRG